MSILPTHDYMWDQIPHDAYAPGLFDVLLGRRRPLPVYGEDELQNGAGDQLPDINIPIPGQQPPVPPYLAPRMGMARKAPGKMQRVLGGMGGVLASVADAVGTENIAGGGPVDIARSFQNAQKGNRERDIAAYNMRRQLEIDAEQRANNHEMRQYRQAQVEREKALADYYLQRAEGTAQKAVRTGFDKFGNLLNMETGELLRQAADPKRQGQTMRMGVGQLDEIGGYEPPSSVNPAVSEPGVTPVQVPGSMFPVEFPAYGRMLDVTPEEFSKVMNSDTMRQNSLKPKPAITYGYDSDGRKVAIQTRMGANGPEVTSAPTGAVRPSPAARPGGGSTRPRELTAAGKVAIEARKNRAIDMANKDLLTGKGTVDLWRTRLQNAQISYENELKAAGFQVQHDDWYKQANPPRRSGPGLPGAPQTTSPSAPPRPAVPTLRNPGPAPANTEVRYKGGIPYVFDRNVNQWIPQISTVK